MAQVVARGRKLSTTRSSAVLSALEEFIQPSKHPLSIILPLYHTSFQRSDAADYLFTLLPRSTVLILRAVSKTSKDWVHRHVHNLLTTLKVTCPLASFPIRPSNKMLHTLASGCRQLTIKLLPSATQIPVDSIRNPSPARQIFHMINSITDLRIDASLIDAFYPLLSLRLALEHASLKSLTLLHFHQLTLPGLLALRWGGFDTFVDATWTGKNFWRRVTRLRVAMMSDWLKWAHQDLHQETNVQKREKMRKQRGIYRQGIQILHDWLFHFSLINKMRVVLFEWIGATGPNPFLLEEEAANNQNGGEWFSAPAITWKGVEEVWLGGVHVNTNDVTMIKLRFDELEKLLVWEELAESIIFGTVKRMEGRDWLDIDLTDDFQRPIDVRMPKKIRVPRGLGLQTGLRERSQVRNTGVDGGNPMVCPFVLRL
ncbi:MAG: hypothetical protein Q9169_002708 [Polycauliona sp. 2 TL-2023]